jgi:hypothetical protein
LAENAEHAAGIDGAVLGGIADEPQGGTGLGGEPAQPVEVTVGDGGGLVDDEDGAGVEGAVWGSSWARYQARVSVGMPVAAARVRAASPLTAVPMTRQPAACQASRAAAMVVVFPAPARPMAH